MKEYTSEILINAPRALVWPILADVENWPVWAHSFSSMRRVDQGRLGVGSRVVIKQPKLPAGRWTITEWNREQSFKWMSKRFLFVATGDHVLIDYGEHCLFMQSLRFQGVVGELAAHSGRALITAYMALEAQGLKRFSEAAALKAMPSTGDAGTVG